MSQQDKQPNQQQGVAQPVHAAASLPYQIAYISVPQAGADGTGQAIRAVPFHIVPVLGQMPGLQMHHVAQLLQGQQLQQAAVYQDAARQGAVLAQGAGTSPAVLANLDPAMRAALASPVAVSAALKSSTVVGSQQTKSGGTAAGAPSASDAAGGAAAAAPAAAGEAASSAAAERINTAAPAAATQAVADGVEAAAGDGKEPAASSSAAAVSPARAQKGQRQKMQQQRTADAAGLPLLTTTSATLPDEDVPTSPAAAAMAAAAAAAASQIPAAAQAAIAAAEAAAAAAAAAGAAGPLLAPTLAAAAGGTAPTAAVGSPAAQQQQPSNNEQFDIMLLDSDPDVAAAISAGLAGAAAAMKGPSERECRLKQRHAFTLKRKFADLTAQIEGALCESRALSSWKHSPRPVKIPRLDESERKMLAASRARRLAEAAAKNCLGVIKAVMAHKFAFPFNSPVDLTKYVDYCSYIKTPMDFGSMKVKVEEGRYAEPAEVYNDALLVFANAKVYNQPTEDVYYMATVLQEFFQERWQKLVVPKLQEDAKVSRGEEDQLRGRKASAARHAAEAAAKEMACRLVAHLDELHEQLAQLRVQAALLCEPLPGSDRSSLAAALDALPLKQLEAALGLVLPRMAAGLFEGQQQQQRGQEGKLEVEVDLARCSALELRQLQHFVAACHTHNISKQQQLAAGAAAAAAAPVPTADTNRDTQQAGASGAVAPNPAEGAAAAADPGLAAAPGAAAAAAVGNVDAVQAAPGTAAAAAGSADPAQAVPSTAAAAAAAGAHSMSGFPVVCVHSSASLSERAGIIWPGQVIGAGLKPRSRLLLPGHADQPPAAAALGGGGGGTMVKGGPFGAALGNRRSSETGAALTRPPLPPSARPSRLATNSGALQPAAAAAAVHSPTLPSPFAGPAATMVPPASLDCTPAVTHTSGRRQQLIGASSSTDLQQQQQQEQQQQEDQQRQQQQGLQLGEEGQGRSEGDRAAASGASLGTGRSSGNTGSLGTRRHARNSSNSSSSSGSDTDNDCPGDQQQQRAESNQQEARPSAASPSTDSRAASVPDDNDTAAAAATTAAAATAISDSDATANNVESADEEFVDAAEAAADESDDRGQDQDDAGKDMQE